MSHHNKEKEKKGNGKKVVKSLKYFKLFFDCLLNFNILGLSGIGLEKLIEKLEAKDTEEDVVGSELNEQIAIINEQQKNLKTQNEQINLLVNQNKEVLTALSSLYKTAFEKDDSFGSSIYDELSKKYQPTSDVLSLVKPKLTNLTNTFQLVLDCKEENYSDEETIDKVKTYQKSLSSLFNGESHKASIELEKISYNNKKNETSTEQINTLKAITYTCQQNYSQASRTFKRSKDKSEIFFATNSAIVKQAFLKDFGEDSLTDDQPIFAEKYIIEALLGSSGMGTVYLARVWETNEHFAIKVIKNTHHDEPDFVKRFQKEINILSKFDSKHVVKYYEHGVFKNRNYCVMEYVEGFTLGEYLQQNGSLSEIDFYFLTKSLLFGLKEIHEKQIIHRDIKDSNIMICFDEYGRMYGKYIDFGISKDINQIESTFTRLSGNHMFAPEEQLRGQVTNEKTDYFSLMKTVLRALIYDLEPKPSMANNYSGALKTIFAKGVASEPVNRFDNIEEMLKEINNFYLFTYLNKLKKGVISKDLNKIKSVKEIDTLFDFLTTLDIKQLDVKLFNNVFQNWKEKSLAIKCFLAHIFLRGYKGDEKCDYSVKTGNYVNALAQLEIAKNIDPNDARTNYFLGVFYDIKMFNFRKIEALKTDLFRKNVAEYQEKAYYHYEKAAKKGHMEAMFEIATRSDIEIDAYLECLEVEKNENDLKSNKKYKSDNSHITWKANLPKDCLFIEPDYKKAIYYYSQLVKKGESRFESRIKALKDEIKELGFKEILFGGFWFNTYKVIFYSFYLFVLLTSYFTGYLSDLYTTGLFGLLFVVCYNVLLIILVNIKMNVFNEKFLLSHIEHINLNTPRHLDTSAFYLLRSILNENAKNIGSSIEACHLENILGYMYLNGFDKFGISKKHEEAILYFEDKESQEQTYNFAYCQFHGYGCNENKIEACQVLKNIGEKEDIKEKRLLNMENVYLFLGGKDEYKVIKNIYIHKGDILRGIVNKNFFYGFFNISNLVLASIFILIFLFLLKFLIFCIIFIM